MNNLEIMRAVRRKFKRAELLRYYSFFYNKCPLCIEVGCDASNTKKACPKCLKRFGKVFKFDREKGAVDVFCFNMKFRNIRLESLTDEGRYSYQYRNNQYQIFRKAIIRHLTKKIWIERLKIWNRPPKKK